MGVSLPPAVLVHRFCTLRYRVDSCPNELIVELRGGNESRRLATFLTLRADLSIAIVVAWSREMPQLAVRRLFVAQRSEGVFRHHDTLRRGQQPDQIFRAVQ